MILWGVVALLAAPWTLFAQARISDESKALEGQFAAQIQPLVRKYCISCHSAQALKGDLDLERFVTFAHAQRDPRPWQALIEQIEAGEMPPKEKPQPTAAEKQLLVEWARRFLDAEARAQAGDPGHVPLRRLSNAEYDYTIRDLTGVDLRPTREFPADGAAGEGFTNAAEALTDISPALLTKYLNAAKGIAEHAVLLPDGFRFSQSKTRRDWTDESTQRLRDFYKPFGADGRLDPRPYILATVQYRDALLSGTTTLDQVAQREKLNPRYLTALWQAWTDPAPSYPLDAFRARWRTAQPAEAASLADAVAAWQRAVWKFVPIGSYRHGDSPRQQANDPAVQPSPTLRLAMKPAPGEREVTLYLTAQDLLPRSVAADASKALSRVMVWQRPRFEAPGKAPLLLRDYVQFGAGFEFDWAGPLGQTAQYLAAAQQAASAKRPLAEIAQAAKLDAELLARWVALLNLGPPEGPSAKGREIPFVPVKLLEEKTPANDQAPAVWGWRRKGAPLPTVVSNASDQVAQVPGRVSPHKVSMHPNPREFVAVAWTSPVTGVVHVKCQIADAHAACGNGVAWWLEHRRGESARAVAEGSVALGQAEAAEVRSLAVAKGDVLLLAIDPKEAEYTCDMTEVEFTIREAAEGGKQWMLSADVADSIRDGNPHADQHGNDGVWSFVEGPMGATGRDAADQTIPRASLLGRWRVAATDPTRAAEASQLAGEVQALLTGPRPGAANDPNRVLYDQLVTGEGRLFHGLDVRRFAPTPRASKAFALPAARFGGEVNGVPIANDSLLSESGTTIEIRLPAALLAQREFVVEVSFATDSNERAALTRLASTPPEGELAWDGKTPLVADPKGPARARLFAGLEEFRRVFPTFLCFPRVVPTDEVVSLKMFHREDEPLLRLFLDPSAAATLERLWAEHRFISRQPQAENDYLPQFIGYVTQDQPKELLAYFESQRPVFQQRADDFARDQEAAVPVQLRQLADFASRAYRRPLAQREVQELDALYRTLRAKGADHDEAFRGVLAKILVAPAFLLRIERAPPGLEPTAVTDWELATRLSYFLWASTPDDELRRLAAAGELHRPEVLRAQVRRMVKDGKVRALAVEFGTQWIHVRGFDELREKNEKLFPTFNADLRAAMYEEAILLFQDIFQSDRPVLQILDADFTYLNELLARHYAIPGVTGSNWRRVDGVKKYGRGGILGLAAVQTKQSGASRTSPTLRGTWVVEVLLGEKLPKPPPNVPAIPEEEGAEQLTTRQIVERHARDAACAGCHVRVDPLGFALERYDTIGRLREKDSSGNAIDALARLKDGTELEGLPGLRTYLLTHKKAAIERLFCRRLLGYALGRSVTLSDTALLDRMTAALAAEDGRVLPLLDEIVQSPQFRQRRGAEAAAR